MFMIVAVLLLMLPTQSKALPTEADAKKAELALAINAEDPAANLTMGKYLAFAKGDWDKALPHLAKGSDALLKPVVEQDLANPKDPKEQVKLGDAWVGWSEKAGALRAKAQGRALHWYQVAWPFLEGADKESIRRVFYKISSPPPDYDKPSKKRDALPPGWEFGPGGSQELGFARTGKGAGKLLPAPESSTRQAVLVSSQYPIVPGKKYKLTAWVYTDRTDADGKFDVGFWTIDGKLFGHGIDIPPIHMDMPFWKKVEKEGTAPEESFRIQIRPWSQHSKGAVWIDDVSLVIDGKELLRNGSLEEK